MMEKNTIITVLGLLVMLGLVISPGYVLADETSPQLENQYSKHGPVVPGLEEPLETQRVPGFQDPRGDDPLEGLGQNLLYTEDGLFYVENRHSSNRTDNVNGSSPNSTGGPDNYGYTWERLEDFDWIDVSTGTDTGIDSDTQFTGMIDIGFDFRYYENTYNKIYVSRHGFVSFNDEFLTQWQSRIPSPELPNDVIAPHWVPSHDINYVRYQSEGISPNRWFVVEWNQLLSDSGQPPDIFESIYTFELILFENGDIQFQYDEMVLSDYGWYCQSSGIEDSDGLDGLMITSFCHHIESHHAVRITRPEDSARVSLTILAQRGFAGAGQSADYALTLRNNGNLGTDSYTLGADSTWPLAFFEEDGVTPIDAVIELEQGASITIIVRVTAPGDAAVGDANEAMVAATSRMDATKSKTVKITAAVPAPFAQVLYDDAEEALITYLVTPERQELVMPFDDYYYDDMGILELPNSNLLFTWSERSCIEWRGTNCLKSGYLIKYAISDRWGDAVLPPTVLSDTSAAEFVFFADWQPYLAVAPNGNIGVLWYRYLYIYDAATETFKYNYNIHFAILDPGGEVLHGPENITGDEGYYGRDAVGYIWYGNPRLTASEDGRFLLAWEKEERTETGVLRDIFYSIRGNSGETVVAITNLTESTVGDYVGNLTLTDLEGERVFIAWYQNREICDESGCWWEWGTVYTVLDSSGDEIKAQAYFNYEYFGYPDSIQLPDGTILWAGTIRAGSWRMIGYMLFDGNSYEPLGEERWLPLQEGIDIYDVSVSKDTEGHAILTWKSSVPSRLYYALIASDGELVTAPMIFYQPAGTGANVRTSSNGQGNTTYRDKYLLFLPLILK